MMTTADRVNHIIEQFCGGNANEFARKTGIGKSAVCLLRNGTRNDTGIGAYAERIARAFPRVNCRWLLTGCGSPSTREAGQDEISSKLDMIIKKLDSRK